MSDEQAAREKEKKKVKKKRGEERKGKEKKRKERRKEETKKGRKERRKEGRKEARGIGKIEFFGSEERYRQTGNAIRGSGGVGSGGVSASGRQIDRVKIQLALAVSCMILVDSIHLVALVCALAYCYAIRVYVRLRTRVCVYICAAPSFMRFCVNARGKPRKLWNQELTETRHYFLSQQKG